MTAHRFTPADFEDAGWATAAQKAKLVNDTLAFLRDRAPYTKFTNALYTAFHMQFGHIAHYDKSGFHAEWFATASKRLAFLAGILDYDFMLYPADRRDVRTALQGALRSSSLLKIYELDAARERNATLMKTAVACLDAMPPAIRSEVLERYGMAAAPVAAAVATPEPYQDPVQESFFALGDSAAA